MFQPRDSHPGQRRFRSLLRTATVSTAVAVSCALTAAAAPAVHAAPAAPASTTTEPVVVRDPVGDVKADRWSRRHHPRAVRAVDVRYVRVTRSARGLLLETRVRGLLKRPRQQMQIIGLWPAANGGPSQGEAPDDLVTSWGSVQHRTGFTTMPGSEELCTGATWKVRRQAKLLRQFIPTECLPSGRLRLFVASFAETRGGRDLAQDLVRRTLPE